MPCVSSIPVLGIERFCPQKGCPWPRIFFVSLALSLVSLTPPLVDTSSYVASTSYFVKIYGINQMVKELATKMFAMLQFN